MCMLVGVHLRRAYVLDVCVCFFARYALLHGPILRGSCANDNNSDRFTSLEVSASRVRPSLQKY
jgi:hypothetical protein